MPATYFSARSVRRTLAAAAACVASAAFAQEAPKPPPEKSALDSQLFYQLLIGEIELRTGSPGNAYEVVLDAARRTKDEDLFRRATDIALQARAGDQALAAARAWRTALPTSLEAHRTLVQLLLGLGRPTETVEPLRSLIALTPPAARPALIDGLPRFFARAPDAAQSAGLLEQVLLDHAKAPATRVASLSAIGRAWLAVPNADKALALAQAAHALDAAAEAPAMLAVQMLPATPAAEALVTSHLVAQPKSTTVRLMYVRALTGAQRYTEAITQLDAVTANTPELPGPWLTLGALHVELRHPELATKALLRYVQLAQAAPAAAAADSDDDNDEATGTDRGLTQAWLMLAQAAEQQRDFKAAEGWLARIENPQNALEVQARRASLLARQGRVAEARELIRRVPERGSVDLRGKLLAEAQVLRDVKQWREANSVLAQANEKFPNDVDLLYEQSMMAEKLNRLDEMERLLRRVIDIKPDHHHAYNALGYSLADRGQRLPEARALIQKALSLSPGEPFITDSLGWVEFRMGNRDEALRLLRSAYQARPDPEIAAHLGEVLWALGQRDEARRVWREAKTRDSTNDVLRETLARLKADL
jgi:tetratricopeptide (TPR) repeat protein